MPSSNQPQQEFSPLPLNNVGRAIADDQMIVSLIKEFLTLGKADRKAITVERNMAIVLNRIRSLKSSSDSLVQKRLNVEHPIGTAARLDTAKTYQDFEIQLSFWEDWLESLLLKEGNDL